MEKRQVSLRPFLFSAFLVAFAASLSAQTWNSAFVQHDYNISDTGHGTFTSTVPTVTLPFRVTRPDGTISGTVRLRYPASLPEGTIRRIDSGDYLVFSSPVTVGFHLELDYAANATSMPHNDSAFLRLEISSGYTVGENSPCIVQRPLSTVQSGTTTHFSDDWSCTFSRVTSSGNRAGDPIVISNYIDFTSFVSEGACGICTTLGNYISRYKLVSPLDLTVSRIEVAQVTQDVNNSIRLVADKATLARVFIGLGSEAVQPPEVTGILRGRNAAGVELPGSPLHPLVEPIRAPNRPNRGASFDALTFILPHDWTAAGTITLQAEVNPNGSVAETDRTNNTREQTAVFLPRNEFAVRWFPVCYLRKSDTDGSCPSTNIMSQEEKMARMYPVGEGRLSYSRLDVPRWTWPYRFSTDNDRSFFKSRLRLQWEFANDGTFDQMVAWMPDLRSITVKKVIGSSDGFWNGGTTGRVSWAMDILTRDPPGLGQSANVLAHEVGHNLGLRHTNTKDCGGCDNDPGTDWPDATSGRIHEVGFDPHQPAVIDAGAFDLMTYNNNPGDAIWISPFHYNKLFDGHFRPMRATAAADTAYAFITGSAKRDGTAGSLDPVVTFATSGAAPASLAGGNHCIRFSGAAGTLSDFCFELSFRDSEEDADLDEEFFALRVPYPAGATRASLRRGEVELAARAASASAPTVTITRPAAGEVWDGTRSVAWQGSDADGDALTYTVLYSGDGGTKWLPIETNTTSTEFAFDTAEIASGDRVHFRVLASDGFRTGEASVGPLTVVAAPIIGVQGTADFGSVKLGAFGETTVLITNIGKKALSVTAIRSSLGDFTSRDSFPLVVAPGGRRSLTVRFTPAAEGVRSATVSFDSDDPARPVVTAQLFGAGVGAPAMQLAPFSLDFGSVVVGASKDLTVTIRNTGRGALTVAALSSSNSQFTLGAPVAPFSIPEGGQVQVTVSFRPVNPGSQAATLSVAGNAGATPIASIPLTGLGTGTGAACAQAVSPGNVSLGIEGGARTVTVSAPAGCTWFVSANASWITVTSGATGAGSGAVSFSIGPNSGAPRAALLAIGGATAAVVQEGGTDYFVVPAVASTPGALDSFFKTGVQLHNPTSAPMSGDVTYHPAGASAEAEDQTLSYRIEAGQTVDFADLLPAMQRSGLGSADLTPRTGSAPVATFRIFNDAGDAGTTGMTEELFRSEEALEAGQKGVLIAPPEPSRARFNLGVRSLAFGATIRFTVRDSGGTVRTTGAKFLPPSFFSQQTAESFLGIALLANDTITFEVDAGSAILYGATTDNTTQDPSLQFAKALGPGSDPRRTIAAVAAAPGVLDSLFKTTLQLHNPTPSTISGRLVFHPGGFSGSDSDPTITYTLSAGATTSYADVLAAFGRTGLGSLDILATTGPAPLAVARVFNDGGARGTTGFSVDAARPQDALQAGETGVLLAPADPATTRFNVGLRTFDAGATLSVTIRDKDGATIRTFPKVYAPSFFEQQAGSVFLGAAPGPSESVAITVTAGSAIVYGASTDNKTQDPALQVARALRP